MLHKLEKPAYDLFYVRKSLSIHNHMDLRRGEACVGWQVDPRQLGLLLYCSFYPPFQPLRSISCASNCSTVSRVNVHILMPILNAYVCLCHEDVAHRKHMTYPYFSPITRMVKYMHRKKQTWFVVPPQNHPPPPI